jgi:hypothetical protein
MSSFTLIRAAIAALFAASVLSAGSPPAVLAGADSDIPGIPLPGPIATGLLGGPVYDVVYRLDVQAGYVIVVGLTGTTGADFDLYLFDSTATTVQSNQGLLAKSTGPTASEHLAYPSFYGGTYYIDLNGATDVEGTYTLSVQLVKDQSVPVASLLIAAGRPSINTTTVTARVTALASLSGVAQMAFSPDGSSFGPWQTYTVESSWTFPPGDGPKTLWVKVKNGVGTESEPTSDTIVLDTVPPSPTQIVPTPNSTVGGLRPTFIVGFSEPIDPSSWTTLGLVVQASNGQPVAGAFAYDATTRIGSFVPAADLEAGGVYVVTVGDVRDVAGNRIQLQESWTITPLLPTRLTISASSSIVARGTGVTISGVASGLDGLEVILEQRANGSSIVTGTGPFTPSNGTVAATLIPQVNTWYGWRYIGSGTTAPAASPEIQVLVRRSVVLAGISSSATRIVRAGRSVSLKAQVGPAGQSVRISFQLYRYDPARHGFRRTGSWGRSTDALGRASLRWSPAAGRYYWRVAVLSSAEYASNMSPAYRWTVAAR